MGARKWSGDFFFGFAIGVRHKKGNHMDNVGRDKEAESRLRYSALCLCVLIWFMHILR